MHTRPRPHFVMTLIASGVAFSAAITRSPSSSRLWSSTTITMRPAEISSSATSSVSNGAVIDAPPCGIKMRGREPCDVLGHDVHLDVDAVAGALAPDGGRGKGVRNYRHREALVGHPGDGQADAIDGNGSFFNDVGGEILRDANLHPAGFALRPDSHDCPHVIHMSLHQMPSQARVQSEWALQVHPMPRDQRLQGGAAKRLCPHVDTEPVAANLHGRQADPVHSDASADGDLCRYLRTADGEAANIRGLFHREH